MSATKKQSTVSTEATPLELFFSLICKYLLNPIGWSFVAYGSGVAINTIQLIHYVKFPGTIVAIDSWSYAADIYLNVVTILCISRFVELGLDSDCIFSKPSLTWPRFCQAVLELCGLPFQLFSCYVYAFETTFDSRFVLILTQCQIVCALLSMFFCSRTDSWFDTVVDYNNTLLPVLLVHSFRFVNCDFPANVVSLLNPILLTAVYLVKFYCVMEYVYYEIRLLTGTQVGPWMRGHRWAVILLLLHLILFDLCYIALQRWVT